MARRRLTPAQPGFLRADPPPERAEGAADVSRAKQGSRMPPIAQVAGQSAEAAALRDITAGIEAARQDGRMVLDVPLADIARDHLLRDRIALDREALDALKASIALHGQRVPAEITPLDAGAEAPGYGLISGWRRLCALEELHAETGEARFSSLRALLRPAAEAAEAYTAMVEENELRAQLSYYERARIVAEAASRGVFADQSAALRGLFGTASRAKRSKIGSFIDIHESLGDLLRFPAEIPERLGLALVSELRRGGRVRLRSALTRAAPETSAAELALLDRLARPKAAEKDVSRAKRRQERLAPDVELTLTEKEGARSVTLTGAGVDDALLARLRGLFTS